MNNHPYANQSPKAFWSQSVSKNFDSKELINPDKKLLIKSDRVASAGSCFASNLVPYIESAGLEYIRTEKLPNIFEALGENLGYANFSARYGNVYTARQLRQLYERAIGQFKPIEDCWVDTDKFIDPFRPGLKYPASSKLEFDLITNSHLKATRKAFEACDVFVFTLGLTEGWISRNDGSTYPACPGTIAGSFDTNKYEFKNFNTSEIVSDLSWFIETLTNNNKKIRFIVTVSPVPLVATATDSHVLLATTYSKSVLRIAAEEVSKNFKNVTYFPAYEIITGPQAPENFFESDRRNVSREGVDLVMKTLLEASGLAPSADLDFSSNRDIDDKNLKIENISKQISLAECDEVMLDAELN